MSDNLRYEVQEYFYEGYWHSVWHDYNDEPRTFPSRAEAVHAMDVHMSALRDAFGCVDPDDFRVVGVRA